MDTEKELVLKAGCGDTEAFGQLVRQYERRVYNMARNMCGHDEDAFDISQDVFLRVWKGLKAFRGDAAFSTWLFRLTSNVCTDYARKKARRSEVSLTFPSSGEQGEIADLPDSRYEPEQELERRDMRRAVADALDKLSLEHKTVLAMRESSGMSYAEIAESLGIEEGTVKSRIARARAQMRMFLLENGNLSRPASSNRYQKER